MTEDTLTKIEQDNEALIQEALRDAKIVEVPSELSKNPVIHKGDTILEAPMTLREITSAGHVQLWDSRTFEKFPVLYYMVPQKLRQRRPDGSYRFTTNDPKQEQKHGEIKCMLHSDGENRKHYDELGFRTCMKSNITNPHQLTLHMKGKHKQEWGAIEQERTDMERKEDRDLQRLILTNQLGQMPKEEPEKAPLYVSAKDKKKLK